MGDAIRAAVADFNRSFVAAAQVGAGVMLLLVGLSIMTGVGQAATRTAIKVAKVIR